MELTHQFTVPAPVEVAWAAFNDLERIAPCFPGASLTSYDGEGFEGLCKVKLGPISLQYTGTGRFVERDESTHRAVIEAKGKDKRGNGTASAAVTAALTAAGDDATDVTVTTDLSITGKPAQFGRGVMQDVSDKLLAQFASCLETKLGADDQEEPAPEADTPIAAEAAAAAKSAEPSAAPSVEPSAAPSTAPSAGPPTSASTGPRTGSTSRPSGPAAGGLTSKTAYQRTSTDQAPPAELDLGATVLPVLLKRYALHIIGGLLLLWLLRRMLRRG